MTILKFNESVKEYEKSYNNIKNEINPTLNEIVDNLIKLTNEEKIDSFAFRDNSHLMDSRLAVFCYVNTKEHNIILGAMNKEDFKEYINSQPKLKISNTLKKQLSEINLILNFLSFNFSNDLPLIKKTTYFSKKLSNENQNELFPEAKVTLLPDFYTNSNSIKKNKPSPK